MYLVHGVGPYKPCFLKSLLIEIFDQVGILPCIRLVSKHNSLPIVDIVKYPHSISLFTINHYSLQYATFSTWITDKNTSVIAVQTQLLPLPCSMLRIAAGKKAQKMTQKRVPTTQQTECRAKNEQQRKLVKASTDSLLNVKK